MVEDKNEKRKGLTYKALDLHVHTPASQDDYQEKAASPSDIVDAAIRKGLDGICITDHNSAEWVDKVAEAAEGQPLTVFPGVEISVTGGKEGPIHIVGIFDTICTAEEVNDVLSTIELTADKRGSTDELARGDPNQVIDAITKHGGLAILAHADSTHGVLHDMTGQPRIKVIQNPNLIAAEASSKKYGCFLDGKDPHYKRELPTYEASDAHKPSEIGAKFHYFKVQDLSLESLRQCFYDHQVRMRRRDQYKAFRVPRIVSLTMTRGFFAGEEVSFHEGLNTLVGGQGVGKSLLVEFLRFALDQTSTVGDILSDTEGKLKDQLGLGGQVKVYIELPNGTAYQIIREYNAADNPLTVTNLDTGEPFDGDIGSLFRIMAYSQTEAIYIARDPQAQRELIDRFIDAPSFQRRMNDLIRELQKNDQQLVKVLDAKDQLAAVNKDISTIREEIRNVEKSLQSPIFEEMKNADQHKAAFKAELDYHDSLVAAVDEFADNLSLSNQPRELASDLLENPSLQRANELSRSSLKHLQSHLEASIAEINDNRKAVKTLLDQWMPHYDEVKSRYEAFLSEAGGDQQRLELKRKELVDRLGELEQMADDLQAKSERLTRTLTQRNGFLDRLDEARNDFFEARKEKYEELSYLSKGKLLLDIAPSANTEGFSEALKAIATGTKIRKKDLGRIAARVSPRDFIDLVLNNDVDTLAKRGDVTLDTVEKLVPWLKTLPAQEEVLALQHQYLPQDVPSIGFRKEDGKYYDLSGVSTGQKCTALLIIAMSAGTCPIIVDQPEEAIDIAFVYNDIVSTLRSGKEHRQFILITHNPNIAVTADSDLLQVLKSSATHGRVVHSGVIEDDEVRAEVIQHLEGGQEPYLLRGKKYGLIDGQTPS